MSTIVTVTVDADGERVFSLQVDPTTKERTYHLELTPDKLRALIYHLDGFEAERSDDPLWLVYNDLCALALVGEE